MFILLLLLMDLYLDPGSHHRPLATWGWDQKKETHVFKYARKLIAIQVDMIASLSIADRSCHSVHNAFFCCLDVELQQTRFKPFTDANSDVDWAGDAIDDYCTRCDKG